jgi:hypothetical protein
VSAQQATSNQEVEPRFTLPLRLCHERDRKQPRGLPLAHPELAHQKQAHPELAHQKQAQRRLVQPAL